MTTPSRFLERWSRLKRQADAPAARPAVDVPAPTGAAAAPEASGALLADPVAETPATADALPPVETLSLDADFTGFLKKEVGESLRRAALRKLFSDPHFNRMDGLDVYIDDYNVADPIPPDVMKRLRQFQTFLNDEQEQRAPGAATEDLPFAEGPGAARGSEHDAGAGRTAEGGARAGDDPAGAAPVAAPDPAPRAAPSPSPSLPRPDCATPDCATPTSATPTSATPTSATPDS